MTPEFELIQQYFNRATQHTDLSVGDDAAILSVPLGQQLIVSADTSVVGTHFFANCAPYAVGWKALAVNVSDIAAMGGKPMWATLALTLPSIDHEWLSEFSRGFFACAHAFNVDLIGGDTTRGPLNISITIFGQVPRDQALLRSGAKAGDDIWVSGAIGSAALGLAHLQQAISLPDTVLDSCVNALQLPQPRALLGLALRGVANSCIDVSDGLLADLRHVLKASNLGARILTEQVPCLDFLQQRLTTPTYLNALLAGGDDYELCFTASKHQREHILGLAKMFTLPLTCIGETTENRDLAVIYQGQTVQLDTLGFDHFG